MKRTTFLAAVVTAAILGLTAPAVAAPAPEPTWVGEASIPNASFPTATSVAMDEFTGDTYVAGTVGEGSGPYDLIVAAFTRTGQLRWQARYDGPSHGFEFEPRAAFDRRTGTLYVSAQSDRADGWSEIVTVAYDRQGRQRWVDRYGSPGAAHSAPNDVEVDVLTGRAYVTGYTAGPVGYPRVATTLAYDRNGRRLWERQYAAGDSAAGWHLAVDPANGGVRVAIQVDLPDPETGYRPAQTVQAYDRSGVVLWSRTEELAVEENAEAAGIAVARGGRTVLLIETERFGQDAAVSARLSTYDHDGTLLWAAAEEGSPGVEHASDLVVDPRTGTVYVTSAWIALFDDEQDDDNRMTFAYSLLGRKLWRTDYADALTNPVGRYGEQDAFLALDPGRGLYAVTLDFFGESTSTVTRAFTTSGVEQWRAEYRANQNDPAGVVVDRARRQVVVGAGQLYSGGPANEGAIIAIAYSALGRS